MQFLLKHFISVKYPSHLTSFARLAVVLFNNTRCLCSTLHTSSIHLFVLFSVANKLSCVFVLNKHYILCLCIDCNTQETSKYIYILKNIYSLYFTSSRLIFLFGQSISLQHHTHLYYIIVLLGKNLKYSALYPYCYVLCKTGWQEDSNIFLND
jgi:hypothetical protein